MYVWDEGIAARTYISYIAEQAGSFACIGRDGKLYFRKIGENVIELGQKYLKNKKFGDPFKVSRIAYEDGVQDFKNGTTDYNTIWINQENMYITSQEQIDAIYEYYKDFECYSFSGTTIIDPAIDVGDVLAIGGKNIIYQGDISYAGKFLIDINSQIKSKEQEENSKRQISETVKRRRIESRLDTAEGVIELLAEETMENEEKISELEISIGEIETKVSNTVDITREISGIKKLTLENTMAGELLELYIYGNNTVFKPLLPSDTLYPSDDLYPMGDSLIKVTRQTVNNDGEIESEESEIIDLEITEELRQKDDVRDEVSLVNNVLKLTRRIGVYADGTTYIKATPEITTIKDLKILTARGNLIIEILNYTAPLKSRYVTINDFTNVFTTTVEMLATIKLLYDQISLDVSHKVDNNDIFARMNMYIKGLGNQTEIPDDIPRSVVEFFANSFSWEADHSSLTADGILTLKNKATEPYVYTINDVLNVLKYLKEELTLTDELLELYDVTGDGTVNVLDSVKMLNIIKGNIESDKYVDAEIIFNPLNPSEFIVMKLAGVVQCRMGLNEIYNYTFRGMNMFLGVFADIENQYGISLNGEKGIITVRSEESLTETRIDADKVDGYYVLATNGGTTPSKGRCMHGYDEKHDYRCHWNGSSLEFIVNDTTVSSISSGSSDKKLKEEIAEIDTNLLKAICEVELKQFKLIDGSNRLRFGIIAQELVEIFEKYELNYEDYDFVSKRQIYLTDETLYFVIEYEQLLILKTKCLENTTNTQQKKNRFLNK